MSTSVWEKASHIPKSFGINFVGHNLMIATINPALPMALHIPTLYDYTGVRKKIALMKIILFQLWMISITC